MSRIGFVINDFYVSFLKPPHLLYLRYWVYKITFIILPGETASTLARWALLHYTLHTLAPSSLPASCGFLRLGRQLAEASNPTQSSIVQSSSNVLQHIKNKHSAATQTVGANSHSYVQLPAWQLKVVPIVKHHAMTTRGGEWIIDSIRHSEKKFSLQTVLCRIKFSTLTSHKVRMPPKRTPWRRNSTYQHTETYFKYCASIMEEPLQTVTFV